MNSQPRSRRGAALVYAYAAVLALPLVCLGVAGAPDLAHWAETGHCPGGPMDRPAHPCGPTELAFIVFLGGWASFLVMPLLVAWWVGSTGTMLAVRACCRRRGSDRQVTSHSGR